MSGTYQWVDQYHDPDDAADWQERVDAWPAVVAYKRRTHQLLAGADRVLDVGCGPGVDLVGSGSVGLDRSLVMLRRARVRSSRPVVAADAVALPFRNGTFPGVRADRIVQHTEDPRVVIAELARVVAPNGTLVVADPDQGTLVIQVPTAPQPLVDLVTERRRTVQYRSGFNARRLPAMFAAAGLSDVTVDAFALTLTDPDDAFGLPTWVDDAVDAGAPGFEHRHRQEWADAMEQARSAPGFVYVVTFLVVAGRKPSSANT